ncbi:DNA repair protein RAD5A-like [Selaginella moellendorffii]|uniref:DNA repair protein RAD5A-like n=1 Tax=Selaginella moellendorffii TaxID=88036 RepID=UPI000D1CDC0B|nr:DNA repair protein RAD5A-like [Selaginella moellendorffii]|eukprot:XP_024522224.1 DNA repair protein RAD5A-like [Selaginella moellendorffii]
MAPEALSLMSSIVLHLRVYINKSEAYEEGDERGLKLLQAILKPVMLRRTKYSTDKEGRPILVLQPAQCEVIECKLSEPERDFYDALYHRSKVKFDQFVEQGKFFVEKAG